MGKRGPQPGFKAARAAASAVAPAADESSLSIALEPESSAAEPEPQNAADLAPSPETPPQIVPQPATRSPTMWENPAHLSGNDLRALGHQRGLSHSGMAGRTDDQIRTELQYIAYRRASED